MPRAIPPIAIGIKSGQGGSTKSPVSGESTILAPVSNLTGFVDDSPVEFATGGNSVQFSSASIACSEGV
jgi:hypothetical protein